MAYKDPERQRAYQKRYQADGSHKKWRQKNKRKVEGYYLKSTYGITIEQYEEMLAKQRGQCAICGGQQWEKGRWGKLKRLAVDHDHNTGFVRGLLCKSCNTAIGLLRDDYGLLHRAWQYIGDALHRQTLQEIAKDETAGIA